MKKAYRFYNDVYFQTFFFLPNWKQEDLVKSFGIDIGTETQGMAFSANGGIFIWIKELNPKTISFLVHECVHAANILFQERGQKISAGNVKRKLTWSNGCSLIVLSGSDIKVPAGRSKRWDR